MSMPDLETIIELAPRLRRKEISPVELTRDCLRRIEKLNPALNAFITVTAESALAEARTAEIEISRGEWRGPLQGIPIALKDLIDTAGTRTTAASALFQDRVPTEDAEVVRRLRQAGAVILGKNNLHEFAYGGSSLVSFFGDVHNPRNVEHVAGGSSGGSAAAVGAGLCYAAIGTDTAGSIREPAALCGCVGLKPTYGRVSARGVIPLSWSLDHVGPLAASVGDAAMVLQAIAGYDPLDVGSADVPVGDYVSGRFSALGDGAKGLRVGIPRAHFYDELDDEVRASDGAGSGRDRDAGGGDAGRDRSRCPTDRVVQACRVLMPITPRMSRGRLSCINRRLCGASAGARTFPRCEYIQRAVGNWSRRDGAALMTSLPSVDLLVTPATPHARRRRSAIPEKRSRRAAPSGTYVLLRNTRPFNVWGLPTIFRCPAALRKADCLSGCRSQGRTGGRIWC
jgi:Asp-tRNA(Asn)/Glu-tRNA(Gln) amidotransferase A subunit family amidase